MVYAFSFQSDKIRSADAERQKIIAVHADYAYVAIAVDPRVTVHRFGTCYVASEYDGICSLPQCRCLQSLFVEFQISLVGVGERAPKCNAAIVAVMVAVWPTAATTYADHNTFNVPVLVQFTAKFIIYKEQFIL